MLLYDDIVAALFHGRDRRPKTSFFFFLLFFVVAKRRRGRRRDRRGKREKISLALHNSAPLNEVNVA